MALGTSLRARLAASAGTVYYVDRVAGDTLNGGTSEALRSSGSDGVTNGTNTLTSATSAWTAGDVGHGISINVGGTLNYRKITAVGGAGTLTFSGATIAAGASRAWKVGGPWKSPQDFFDRAAVASVSPAPGDILEIKESKTTLSGAIAAGDLTLTLPVSPASLGLPASGTLFALELEAEADYSRGIDGVTNGTNTLTAASASWSAADIGRQIWIQNPTGSGVGAQWEKRTVTAVGSATSLTFDGATVAAATLRCWRIVNVELCTCTSYAGNVLTVTRATFGSMASAHANGVRIDFPYTGYRATSLSDSGARFVMQTAGSAGGVYEVRNYAGHDIYLAPNPDTAVGTAGETLTFRTGTAFWRFKRNTLGGSFTIERGRNVGGVNTPNVYFAAGCADIECERIRSRWCQNGSGYLFERSGTAATRILAVSPEAYYNDIDLTTNHHGFYIQGTDIQLWNPIGRDHAFGFGCQIRTTALNAVVVNWLFARNRSTGSGIWLEGDSVGTQAWNGIGRDNANYALRGSTAAAGGSANIGRKTIAFLNAVGSFFNQAVSATLWDWTGAGDNSASGPGDNQAATDPKHVSPLTNDFSLQASSPAYNAGSDVWTPTTDFNGVARVAPTIGPFIAPEEVASSGASQRTLLGVG